MSQNPIQLPVVGTLTGLQLAQDVNLANDTLASCFLGASAPSTTYPGQWWVDTGSTIDSDGPWVRQRNTANTGWVRRFKADSDLLSQLISQDQTAFTTAGTAPNFTITTKLGSGVALAANQRFRVNFNAAGTTGSNTLARDGLAAKNLKQYDSTGAKVPAVVAANMLADVEYDGTDYVILDPLPPSAATTTPPVRQTVLSGPVDTSGNAAFGGSTGSATVAALGTLKATCFAGGDANYIGSITNPSWTGLTTNGTMYLFLDITSGGAVTTASSTVQQVCQAGGTPATTNGLLTVNYQEGKCYLGNGSAAPQAYRVAVGEVTVAGGVVTAITWYALMGRYTGATGTLATSTNYSAYHNIGTKALRVTVNLECVTAEGPYSVGDRISLTFNGNFGTGGSAYGCACRYNSTGLVLTTLSNGIGIRPDTSSGLTPGNWKALFLVERVF